MAPEPPEGALQAASTVPGAPRRVPTAAWRARGEAVRRPAVARVAWVRVTAPVAGRVRWRAARARAAAVGAAHGLETAPECARAAGAGAARGPEVERRARPRWAASSGRPERRAARTTGRAPARGPRPRRRRTRAAGTARATGTAMMATVTVAACGPLPWSRAPGPTPLAAPEPAPYREPTPYRRSRSSPGSSSLGRIPCTGVPAEGSRFRSTSSATPSVRSVIQGRPGRDRGPYGTTSAPDPRRRQWTHLARRRFRGRAKPPSTAVGMAMGMAVARRKRRLRRITRSLRLEPPVQCHDPARQVAPRDP